MGKIYKLKQEIVELEDSIEQRRSRGKNRSIERSSSEETSRTWRYERSRADNQNNKKESDHLLDRRGRAFRRNRVHTKRHMESSRERQSRFDRVREILRIEERNQIKREIILRLIERMKAISFKKRKRFNAEIRKLRYQLLYISTPSENMKDGHRFYRI